MDFKQFNKKNFKTIDWGIDTKDLPFTKLVNYQDGQIINVKGFFFIKDTFNGGLQLVLISANALINCPKHLVETIKELLKDDNAVDSIKNGECSVKVKHYKGKGIAKDKDLATFEFV